VLFAASGEASLPSPRDDEGMSSLAVLEGAATIDRKENSGRVSDRRTAGRMDV